MPATYIDQVAISDKIENEMNDINKVCQALERQLEAIQAFPSAILREVFDFQEPSL